MFPRQPLYRYSPGTKSYGDGGHGAGQAGGGDRSTPENLVEGIDRFLLL